MATKNLFNVLFLDFFSVNVVSNSILQKGSSFFNEYILFVISIYANYFNPRKSKKYMLSIYW